MDREFCTGRVVDSCRAKQSSTRRQPKGGSANLVTDGAVVSCGFRSAYLVPKKSISRQSKQSQQKQKRGGRYPRSKSS